MLAEKGGHHGVAGISGKARENKEKCPLQNKRQCPATTQNPVSLVDSRLTGFFLWCGTI